jgi:hypothetical protein
MALKRGRVAKRPRILESRPLTREDLACLSEKRPAQITAKLRDTHHRVARLFAAGLRLDEVVELSGYSNQRVYQLSTDPAFQELVAQYRGKVDAAFERNQDRYFGLATSNMIKAETMISDKLDEAMENGETLPTRDLISISRDAADRFGYSKHTVVTNNNIGSKLEAAIVRSGKAVTIDAKAVSSPVSSPALAPTPATGLQPPAEAQSQGNQSLKMLALARRAS